MKKTPILPAAILVSCLLGCAPERGITESSQDSNFADSSRPSLDPEPSQEILNKRIEYRDALRRVVEILERRYMQGTDNITSLAKANIELAEAELAAAITQADRIAAVETLLEHAKEREDYARVRMETGIGGTDEMAVATAGRLRAELMLLEEKSRLGQPVSVESAR
ncbi:hypothetical protein [Stieleria varia]|uniref:Outer membrane efflux protein n=1 Tax=Stieleria varia TaxID=2528005 RepID=A0A5C6B3J6_9BACT|nr:hypothetical protein [Stieleria varia]TWU05846.1 hypothetical protein Pla52n_15610 [Stieleria varia]